MNKMKKERPVPAETDLNNPQPQGANKHETCQNNNSVSAQSQEYDKLGWKLCKIPFGQKGPQHDGWNLPGRHETVFTDTDNIGCLHAYSDSCAIDIDDVAKASNWFAEKGIDLFSILMNPKTVQINSGNAGHLKLFYKLTPPLPSKKIKLNGKDIIDFRCATSEGYSVQDVLPPSRHPLGKNYEWVGDWRNAPDLPSDLLALWQDMVSQTGTADTVSQTEATPEIMSIVEEALDHIDPTKLNRIEWVGVGMALRLFDPNLFDLWEKWSVKDPRFLENDKTGNNMVKQWAKFALEAKTKQKLVTIHTIFDVATQGGWKGRSKAKQALSLIGVAFPTVEPTEGTPPPEVEWGTPFNHKLYGNTGPDYPPGLLPTVYEDFAKANHEYFDKATMEGYAGFFLLGVTTSLRPNVRVEPRSNSNKAISPPMSITEQAFLVGNSGTAKSETMAAVCNHRQDGVSIQREREQAENGEIATRRKSMLTAKLIEETTKKGKPLSHTEKVHHEKELLRQVPPVSIINDKTTDIIMAQNMFRAALYNVPCNFLHDESRSIYGGNDHTRDGASKITELHRKAHDHKSYKQESISSGVIDVGRPSMSVGSTLTPEGLIGLDILERGKADGTVPRYNYFAPGRPYEGEKDDGALLVKVTDASEAWHKVQERLYLIREMTLTLETDKTIDKELSKIIKKAAQAVSNGNTTMNWLQKLDKRLPRTAAAMFLVDKAATLDDVDWPKFVTLGDVMIPMEYRRKAWDYLIKWLWPQQVFVLDVMMRVAKYKGAINALFLRMYANKLGMIRKYDIWGDHGPASIANDSVGGMATVKILMDYNWIRPINVKGGVKYDPYRPEAANNFEINPAFRVVFDYMKEELIEEFEIGKGKVLAIDWSKVKNG